MEKERKYDFVIAYLMVSCALILYTVIISGIKISKAEDSVISMSTQTMDNKADTFTVIIDAGHGGEDSGAVSESGILEKELNLLISEQIRDILISNNVNVVMTRTEDRLLYTEEQNIKGQRKINDLRNRYLIAQKYNNAVFVSIHINKFQQSKYKGLQVWFSPNNEKSAVIAKNVQEKICSLLQKDNNRKVKESNGGIYLLDRLECASILIECGFLSNEEDCKNLSDPQYRKKMSALIAYSIIENSG